MHFGHRTHCTPLTSMLLHFCSVYRKSSDEIESIGLSSFQSSRAWMVFASLSLFLVLPQEARIRRGSALFSPCVFARTTSPRPAGLAPAAGRTRLWATPTSLRPAGPAPLLQRGQVASFVASCSLRMARDLPQSTREIPLCSTPCLCLSMSQPPGQQALHSGKLP